MDNLVKLALLYDLYGALLTDKQQETFEAYHHENLSLRELGRAYGISPQGVRDSVKRSEALLMDYEEKVGFLAYQQAMDKKLDNLRERGYNV